MKKLNTKAVPLVRKWERRITSIEESIDASIQQHKNYISKRGGRLITSIRNNTGNTSINRIDITRKQRRWGKQLYGYFNRETNESHTRKLRKGKLKRDAESLLIEALNNPLRTNYIKAIIYNTQQKTNIGYGTITTGWVTWSTGNIQKI